jgi:hypothetical protein
MMKARAALFTQMVRASLIPRDKRPFNVCSRDLRNLFPKSSDLCEGK